MPHPAIKPHHVKHTAAGLTVVGCGADIFNVVPHLGVIMMSIAAVVAIYEPHIVHEISLEIEE